jgi:ubiquinone/menaquinone biosynthesis C-methylase UbiE
MADRLNASDNPASELANLPDSYRRWRASKLGRITDTLEQELILALIGSPDGLRILDVGCGDAATAVILAERGAIVTGIDTNHGMLAVAQMRAEASGVAAQFTHGDIRALSFADDSFDLVLAVTVLCFVEDAAQAVREMTRVLRPGGRLVIGELGRWNLWAAKRRVSSWLGSRVWRSATFRTARTLQDLVASAGLAITTMRGAVYYPPFAPTAAQLARIDAWIGSRTTAGAAFLVVVGRKAA